MLVDSTNVAAVATLVEAAVRSAVLAKAPRRTVAAAAAAVASAAIAAMRSSNGAAGVFAEPSVASVQLKKKRRRKKRKVKNQKTALTLPEVGEVQEVTAESAIPAAAGVAVSPLQQEKESPTEMDISGGDDGGAAAVHADAPMPVAHVDASPDNALEQARASLALLLEDHRAEQLPALQSKMIELLRVSATPVLWPDYGFSSQAEAQAAFDRANAAWKEERQKKYVHAPHQCSRRR